MILFLAGVAVGFFCTVLGMFIFIWKDEFKPMKKDQIK